MDDLSGWCTLGPVKFLGATNHARSGALFAICLALACACGPSAATTPVPEYPGTLRAPSTYADDFVIDHTITAEHAQGSETFRAVVEKRGDAIVMVGLGPHGGRAFTLRQEGERIEFDNQLDRELPFPARYMLLDFHRVWLGALPGAPLSDGEHSASIDGEQVRETWAQGRLLARSFERADGEPVGVISVTYEGGLSPDLEADAPTRVVLDNAWFGYRLVLEGITRRPL